MGLEMPELSLVLALPLILDLPRGPFPHLYKGPVPDQAMVLSSCPAVALH